MAEPWTSQELLDRLREVGARKYHDKHPFHVAMHQGRLSQNQVRGWILNRFYYQKNIPVKDAFILAKLPTREDRRRWLARIIDHDGRDGHEGGIEAWLRLGQAAGLDRKEMLNEQNILPGARFAVDAYVNFCRERPWPEAVAASLTELFAPDLVTRRIEVFEKHYPWVQASGLEYFRQRPALARRDVDHGLELVMRGARTRDDQEKAVAALNFKCDVLWALLDAIERGYPFATGTIEA